MFYTLLSISPPPLHTGILGPGNDAMKFLDEHVDVTNSKGKYHIREAGPEGELNGPHLKAQMSNKNNQLDGLENIVKEKDENLNLFIEHLKILHVLNGVANAKHLDMNSVNNVLQDLR